MTDRPLLLNKKFGNVQEKLKFIQKNCKEPDLFPDLQQLFKNKGYNNVVINHGNAEYGKDLVFNEYDKNLKEEKWFSVIVKNKTASQNDFLPGNEIGNQISTSFKVAYKNLKGEEKYVSSVIIIINGKITGNAIEVIKSSYEPVMKQNIHIWDYDRLCDEIEDFSKESFLNNLEPHITQYQSSSIRELSKINSNSFFDLNIEDINDIFVNVQTTYTQEAKKVNNYVSFGVEDEKLYKDEDIEGSNEILDSNDNFIIHGIPTSGKTLFLRRIGIKALSDSSRNNAVFYIELDKIEPKIFNVQDVISQKYFEITQENFKVENFSKLILLFDGIDFISCKEEKDLLINIIDKYSTDHKVQIILATRDFNYLKGNDKFLKFKETELLPFNFGQALQLVKKIIPNNETKTNSFLKAIKDNILDSTIHKTPLALTLLAVLYRDDHIDLKELPANIFELYDKFTDIYLDRWDASKGLSQQYKYEQTKIIISCIALDMHCRGVNVFHIDELTDFLVKLRMKFNFEELDDVPSYVDYLKTKNNVFYFDEIQESFQFFNHYFQEFFTSLSIEDDDDQLFIDNFFEQWWSNSLIFFSGKKPKSFKIHKSIIEKIIPLDIIQKIIYLQQHSRSLQASHSITIEQRQMVVSKLLLEYNNLLKTLIIDAKENPAAFLNQMPYAGFITFTKNMFVDLFSSKHVSTTEIRQYLYNTLQENNDLEISTRYNISYFLSEKTGNHKPIEDFADSVLEKKDVVWTRIAFVDINFLRYKKKISEKLYIRLKRKMNKNKFLIQFLLRNSIIHHKDK